MAVIDGTNVGALTNRPSTVWICVIALVVPPVLKSETKNMNKIG